MLPGLDRGGDDRETRSDAPVQKKDGKVTHQANVGSGQVMARENDFDPSDKRNDNYSLDYAGKNADKAHWLQFVDRTMYATSRAPDGSTIPAE